MSTKTAPAISPPLQAALNYAARGWPVFPCHSRIITADGEVVCSCGDPECGTQAKHPRTQNGLKDATVDPGIIKRWWARWPDANIGIPTGTASGMIVLDEDAGATESLKDYPALPRTYSVGTWHGAHRYFTYPNLAAGERIITKPGVLPGVDSRGDLNGYVIAPPSVHFEGHVYTVSDNAPLAAAPQWWLDLVIRKPVVSPDPGVAPVVNLNGQGEGLEHYVKAALKSELEKLAQARPGQQNDQLNRSAFALGQFVGAGVLPESLVEDVIADVVVRWPVDPTKGPWTRENLRPTLHSGLKSGSAKPRDLSGVGKAKTPTVFLRGRQARAYIETGDEDATPDEESQDEADKHPYGMRGGRIWFALEKTTKEGAENKFAVVCDFMAEIVEEISTEDGQRSFKLRGRTAHRRPFELEISSGDFADEKLLKAALITAAGAKASVRKGMAGHLAPAIMLLSDDLRQCRSFERTGWDGDTFLIPGRERDGVTIHLPHKLPYGLMPDADLKRGLAGLRYLFQAQSTAMAAICIAAAFQAPLAHLAGWRNERYALFIAGRTGSYKSSWAQTLMTLYGPDFIKEEHLLKWGEGATRNAIMRYATQAHDLPFLIDNYKPGTGGGAKDFINLIQNILEGGEKERMTRAATMRASRAVFAWPVVTGEDVPDNDPASLARVLVVPFPFPTKDANEPLTRAQAACLDLNAVGAAWIDWLESADGRKVASQIGEMFPARRTIWTTLLKSKRPDMVNASRVASNLASNELAWEAMEACPALAALCAEFTEQHAAGLLEVAGGMAHHTTEAMEAQRYLAALRELLATERYMLVTKAQGIPERERDRIIGWHGEANSAYLLPGLAKQAVEGLLGHGALMGLSDQTLYKQLEGIGAIATHDDGRLTKKIRVGDGTTRTLHIAGTHMRPAHEDDEDDEDDEPE